MSQKKCPTNMLLSCRVALAHGFIDQLPPPLAVSVQLNTGQFVASVVHRRLQSILLLKCFFRIT